MRNPRRQSEQTRWTPDPEKESYWKKQLDLWQKSGLSVRAFCKENGVVETSFYSWRRELIIRARESGRADIIEQTAAIRNEVKDISGRTVRVCFRQTDHAPLQSIVQEKPTSPFVPLSIVAEQPVKKEADTVRDASMTITTRYA